MEGLVGEQQYEIQPMRKERWTPSKPKCSPQHDGVPFTKLTTDATGTSPQKRRNGNTPVGYLGRSALREEQCDKIIERRQPLLGYGTVNTLCH
jgi:hypothetical protein